MEPEQTPTFVGDFVGQPEAKPLDRLGAELTDKLGQWHLDNVQRALHAGRLLVEGRAECENADCGVSGHTTNVRFRNWIRGLNLSPPNRHTLHQYMSLARNLTGVEADPALIRNLGLTNCYFLHGVAEARRTHLIEQAQSGRNVSKEVGIEVALARAGRARRTPAANADNAEIVNSLGLDQLLAAINEICGRAGSPEVAAQALRAALDAHDFPSTEAPNA